VVEQGERDRAAQPVGAPPRPGTGPREVRLHVGGSLQLIQPADLGVVRVKPVREDPDRLGATLERDRAEHGADGLHVADDLPVDLGLGDLCSTGVRAGRPARGGAVSVM
jgi:hypothetical protein